MALIRQRHRKAGADHKDAPLSKNMIIHGDNLLTLKALMLEYEGWVDCIYINSPYNTGEEKWVYNDNVNAPRFDNSGRYKNFITYLHQGAEGAVAVNKLVELMKRM